MRKVIALGVVLAVSGFGGVCIGQTTITTGTKTPEQQANYERRVAEHQARIKAVIEERRTSPSAGALPSTAGMTKDERIKAHQERVNAVMKANQARRAEQRSSGSLTAN